MTYSASSIDILVLRGRVKLSHNFRTCHYLTDLVNIRTDSGNIHRNNDLGMYCYRSSQFIVVHLHTVFL